MNFPSKSHPKQRNSKKTHIYCCLPFISFHNILMAIPFSASTTLNTFSLVTFNSRHQICFTVPNYLYNNLTMAKWSSVWNHVLCAMCAIAHHILPIGSLKLSIHSNEDYFCQLFNCVQWRACRALSQLSSVSRVLQSVPIIMICYYNYSCTFLAILHRLKMLSTFDILYYV